MNGKNNSYVNIVKKPHNINIKLKYHLSFLLNIKDVKNQHTKIDKGFILNSCPREKCRNNKNCRSATNKRKKLYHFDEF